MLRNKANRSSQSQGRKSYDSPKNYLYLNLRGLVQAVGISEFFPLRSDDVSGYAAVAAGEITWPNKPISNKATLGQVLRLGLVGHEAGVPRGRWSGPGSEGTLISFEGERVFGIDSVDGAPVEEGLTKDVVDQNSLFANFHAWVPKQQPSHKSKPNVDPNFSEKHGNGLSAKGKHPNGGKCNGQRSHDFAGARPESVSIHSSSLTQHQLARSSRT